MAAGHSEGKLIWSNLLKLKLFFLRIKGKI
jgi:hypothetical protein